MEYRIISADDHIDLQWLPKDLWQTRVPAQWRERAPKVVDTADGPSWVCGNDRWDSWGGRKGAAGAQGAGVPPSSGAACSSPASSVRRPPRSAWPTWIV